MPAPITVTFSAGATGTWRIDNIIAIAGETLAPAPRLAVHEGASDGPALWSLRGVTSNTRYTKRPEVQTLTAVQQPLRRAEAVCAVLIPMSKTAAWWDLAQDERRAIFEEQSHHIKLGLATLPGVARRLHHSRELGEAFDFLTWFEFAPEHGAAFDDLLAKLRATPEWAYVDREVEVRLSRADSAPPPAGSATHPGSQGL